jgi:hypothetical protein
VIDERIPDEQLGGLFALRRWVGRALRQEQRAQAAYVAMRRLEDELMPQAPASEDGWVTFDEPEAVTEAVEQVNDEVYFLILASHQALAVAPTRVTELPLPASANAGLLADLRNVYEHWDDWHVPNPQSVADLRSWAVGKKNRSGRRLAEAYPGAEPRSYAGGTQQELEVVAGVLDVRQMRADLQALDASLTELMRRHVAALDAAGELDD